MLSLERREAILEYLKLNHAATVADLSKRLFASETTIRRDLSRLERAGFVKKTYGGAILVEEGNTILSLDARMQTEKEAKLVIARRAAEMIRNGDVVFFDSSSTALAMLPFLGNFANLSVITHGVQIAAGLAVYPQIRTYCLGGLVIPNIFSCSGALTRKMLEGMRADTLFVSPKAVEPDGGVFCAHEEEAAVRRMMLERSDRTVLLCATKKLNRHAAFHLCALHEVDAIVLDQPPNDVWAERFSTHNVQVI